MSVTEQAFTFECDGEQLVGIVAHAAEGCALGVLVVVGGAQYRVGAHRQYTLLARRLAGAGVPVMRFDCRGMGDSTGGVQWFENIAPDIASGIDAFMRICPSLNQVVLWGICDAGPACLLYWHSTADRRIAGIALLNPWVLSEATYARTKITEYYFRRLFARDFWMKLVRGGLDIANALRSLAGTVTAARAGSGSGAQGSPDFRDRMAAALGQFNGPVLFVLSSADLTAKGFINYCQSDPRWRALLERPNVEQQEVQEADHTFSSAPWREEVEALTFDWLQRAFPASALHERMTRITQEGKH